MIIEIYLIDFCFSGFKLLFSRLCDYEYYNFLEDLVK